MPGPFAGLPDIFVETFGVNDDGTPLMSELTGPGGTANVQGIFRSPQRALAGLPQDLEVMRTVPVLSVPTEQIKELGEPLIVTVSGVSYLVKEIEKEDHGMARLYLERT